MMAFVPAITRTPRRLNRRPISSLTSGSSSGNTLGSTSTTVTSAPRSFQPEANSIPMAPAPRMTTDFGTPCMFTAVSLLITRSPSIVRPGRLLGTEPVATITSVALISLVPLPSDI